ncbi:MAG: hypothetical protein IJA12_04585 [Oscillospiraceae bacterium]|nr:hypothetical protein [Oscillospiraceae bacterium]
MNIGMSKASFVKNEEFPLKAKTSTNAIALTCAIKGIIGEEHKFDEMSLGIVAATSYGPLDTYMSSTEKLFSRGIRGLRPQKVVHSVLCEPSCQVGIQNHAKAFNMTFSGGVTSGFQAMKAAALALEEKMAENILVIGGDDTQLGTVSGAVLLGEKVCDFHLKAANVRFAYDISLTDCIKEQVVKELLDEAGLSEDIYTLSADENGFERSFGGSDIFSALVNAQKLILSGKENIMILETDESGVIGGIIVGK